MNKSYPRGITKDRGGRKSPYRFVYEVCEICDISLSKFDLRFLKLMNRTRWNFICASCLRRRRKEQKNYE